ncbi:hypothetical protein KW782_02075 [Candidatus Parcubacteria bacterium]|nr:hypothetical protein [Candidatus Parcubacteria bacterium]
MIHCISFDPRRQTSIRAQPQQYCGYKVRGDRIRLGRWTSVIGTGPYYITIYLHDPSVSNAKFKHFWGTGTRAYLQEKTIFKTIELKDEPLEKVLRLLLSEFGLAPITHELAADYAYVH